MQHLTYSKINMEAILASMNHEEAGALVLFCGNVRSHNVGKQVDYLEYEAFDSVAESLISKILKDAFAKYPLKLSQCIHRLGKLYVEDTAVVVCTMCAHRKEAYDANQYIVHRLKHEVPIWKKEYFTDGTYTWGNNCNCPNPYQHISFDDYSKNQ